MTSNRFTHLGWSFLRYTSPAWIFLGGLSVGRLDPGVANQNGSPPDPASAADSTAEPGVEGMLQDFVDDYCMDPEARPITFGVEVRDAEPSRWRVDVSPREEGEADCIVTLYEGFENDPLPYFTTDRETLQRIHRGELGSMTAMGKSLSTDFAPLDLEVMDGYEADAATMDYIVRLGFHFWTRGFPERVKFGDPNMTRPLHGGHATLLYYQEGFRSGYCQIRPGEHINAEEVFQTNPFPSLFIATGGSTKARIGDTTCELQAGEAIYIGPGIRHEFWVDEDATEGAEGILLMFGEGA
jgi:mannose-6-phosphate isomerase-like protein (cupin superfamily)